MKLSIKHKLFIAVSGLIILYVLLSWLFNSFLLDKYYFYSKKNALIDSYRLLDSVYRGSPEDIFLELEKMESNRGVNIIIIDKSFEIKYIYNERLRDPWQKRLGRRGGSLPLNLSLYEIIAKLKANPDSPFIIETGRDMRLNTNFISLFSILNNGDYILISTSVEAIEESVDIADKFFLFTGIVTILTGSVLVYFITGRFTEPILQLNKITRRMTALDFSERYPVKSSDEIGQLGASINSLSEQLQKSIFELKEANSRLKEDIEKERKIDEMRKEFISSVSHELKTPIALIQGYAEGLKLNVNEDEENKNFYCDIIIDEALKMNKLVRQLLELSKIESGMVSLERTDFNLSEFVENVLRKNFLVSWGRDINVIIEKAEDIIVNADLDRTEQVLTNYINNAVDHLNEQNIIKVTIQRIGNKARITVFNSGENIQEGSIDKIWTSFYKVDKARTRAYGGTGLGLSIVRAIQDAHQNGCGVDNVENGVEFWFELDISDK